MSVVLVSRLGSGCADQPSDVAREPPLRLRHRQQLRRTERGALTPSARTPSRTVRVPTRFLAAALEMPAGLLCRPAPEMLWRKRFHADGCPSCWQERCTSVGAGVAGPRAPAPEPPQQAIRLRRRDWCARGISLIVLCDLPEAQRVCFCAGERAQSPLSPRSRLRAYEGQTEDPSNVSVSFV